MFNVRSLIIRTAETPIKVRGELLAKQDNEFRKLKDFIIDRSKPDLSVGFDPWAPIVISVPDTESSVYRLEISESDPVGAIADQQVRKMAAELWGNVDDKNVKSARFGKGMILSGMEMQEALDLIKVIPDCRLADKDPALFIHRTFGNSDIYYVSNQSDNQITIAPEFRVSGLSPELWDPVTGSIRALPAYVQNENTTIVPLKLEASGSQFIIFRKKAGKASATELAANFPEEESILELNGQWSVTFDVAGRGPSKPVTFETLQDWTSSSNDSIKYYSGTAFYKTTFSLDEVDQESKLYVDLGTVKAMAKVKLNGEFVGGVWTAPWKADISEAVKAGENILEVEVVNTWVNRLIGDSRLPVAERKTWCSVNPFKPDSPLDPSGLIGPVKIVEGDY